MLNFEIGQVNYRLAEQINDKINLLDRFYLGTLCAQFGHLQNIEDLLMHYAIEVFEHYGKKCSVEIEKLLVSTVGNRARFR